MTGAPTNTYYLILLAAFVVLPLISLALAPTLTREIIRDLRLPRILHYVVLGGMGMALRLRLPGQLDACLHSPQALLFPLFVAALTLAAVFAIVTNNFEDLPADRITNRNRPLVKGTVRPGPYLVAGIASLAAALLLSLAADQKMFAGIATISLIYFIYSCRPFRLKKIPFLSKSLIGFNSLAVAVTGFALAGGKWNEFPAEWAIFILVPLSLAANFVDLKDVEGDRVTGVSTLPVVFGERKAVLMIAFFTIAAYGMAGVLLQLWWAWPMITAVASLHLWFLFRKPFDERWVFLIYVTSLAGMDVFLFFSNATFGQPLH